MRKTGNGGNGVQVAGMQDPFAMSGQSQNATTPRSAAGAQNAARSRSQTSDSRSQATSSRSKGATSQHSQNAGKASRQGGQSSHSQGKAKTYSGGAVQNVANGRLVTQAKPPMADPFNAGANASEPPVDQANLPDGIDMEAYLAWQAEQIRAEEARRYRETMAEESREAAVNAATGAAVPEEADGVNDGRLTKEEIDILLGNSSGDGSMTDGYASENEPMADEEGEPEVEGYAEGEPEADGAEAEAYAEADEPEETSDTGADEPEAEAGPTAFCLASGIPRRGRKLAAENEAISSGGVARDCYMAVYGLDYEVLAEQLLARLNKQSAESDAVRSFRVVCCVQQGEDLVAFGAAGIEATVENLAMPGDADFLNLHPSLADNMDGIFAVTLDVRTVYDLRMAQGTLKDMLEPLSKIRLYVDVVAETGYVVWAIYEGKDDSSVIHFYHIPPQLASNDGFLDWDMFSQAVDHFIN